MYVGGKAYWIYGRRYRHVRCSGRAEECEREAVLVNLQRFFSVKKKKSQSNVKGGEAASGKILPLHSTYPSEKNIHRQIVYP